MYDPDEVARLLDILGNRNRRRIIELLRSKPCFVTEIAETLTISPKAVIDHLQMMEREAILSCQTDERRRKYYFLANDILIDVSLKHMQLIQRTVEPDTTGIRQVQDSVAMLGRMIKADDQILANLEAINHDIETKISDLASNHNDIFRSDGEIIVVIALSHDSLSLAELEQATGVENTELSRILQRFEQIGIAHRVKDQYVLKEVSMQNNPNGPYDEVFSNLAKIVEDLVKNMPDSQHARIVGYTIITRHPESGDPEIFRASPPDDDGEIPYEVTESEDQIFITAMMPKEPKNLPFADIQPDRVTVSVDDRETTIVLDHPIDMIHSYYRIHRGVMDITLGKAKQS